MLLCTDTIGMKTTTLRRPEKFVMYSIVGPKSTKTRKGEPIRYWEVLYRIDERRYRKRFTTQHGGKAAALKFEAGIVAGWNDSTALWDDDTHRWVTKRGLLVGHWLLDYWTLKSVDWSPGSKPGAKTGLVRAFFAFSDGQADPEVVAELDMFLSGQVTQPGEQLEEYINQYSFELADVTADMCQKLLLTHLTANKNTQKSWTNILVGAWELARKRGHIDTNPWDAVVWQKKTKQVTKCEQVLSPTQIWELADVCGEKKIDYKIMVLVMGLCGLRFGEARALTVDCVNEEGTWLTFSQTARNVSSKWLTTEDNVLTGPLKGRQHGEARRVPVPANLTPALQAHVVERRKIGRCNALLFTGRTGKIINSGSFGENVWAPAVKRLYTGTDFELLRKHDLRHAACSAWLSAGVPLKIAQSWSGHKSLNVFLNVYQGVVAGQEDTGVARLNSWTEEQNR